MFHWRATLLVRGMNLNLCILCMLGPYHLFFLLFLLFLIWDLRPFHEYYTYIELIVHQRLAKTREPGEKKQKKKHLTICKQNCSFPHVTRARFEPKRLET